MATQTDHDWQTTKKTVLERNCHLFNNSFMSNIAFTCGESDKKFFAHKYVLASSSPVFYAMFYGDLAEKNSVIHLDDADDESLEEFLRFLYTDQCIMTVEIALRVMYLATKYMVPSLTETCVEVLRSTVKSDNAVTVLEQAIYFDQKELEEKCWEIVDLETDKAITSEAFLTISQETLTSLLKRESLSIEKVGLFQAVLKWSDYQCSKNGSEVTGVNKRAVTGDALNQIRFLSMSQKEFAQYVSSTGLLTAEEMIPIYEKLNGFHPASFKWDLPRRQASASTQFRFARCSESNVKKTPHSWWNYSGSPDRLSFSANTNVKFHGVRLFGDENHGKYVVTMQVDGQTEIHGKYTSELNGEGIYGFDVMLPSPIAVDRGKRVNMAATITGPKSYFCANGKEQVQVGGIYVTFHNEVSDFQTNGTCLKCGQFYEIFLEENKT